MDNPRADTDESLRTERGDTDHQALRDKLAAEQAADAVIDLARQEADALLAAARDKADQAVAIDQAVVESDRVHADALLQVERAVADDRLRRERDESLHALEALRPLERERTDRDLLTERVRSDEALASRDDFLAIVSHDMRNLLGGILMSSGLLSKRASDTEEGRQIIVAGKRIQLYAARMNRLISDLIDVVSIDAGHLACAIVPGDPLALILEMLETFRRPAEEKGLTIEADVAGKALPLAAFDHERILQVLSNLISNAIKFTPSGGKISLRVGLDGDRVRFSVEDSGCGIREEQFASVFHRFWRAGTNEQGTGLGLYISRNLVESHGGRIWVESTVGKGSTFHFTVPLAVAA